MSRVVVKSYRVGRFVLFVFIYLVKLDSVRRGGVRGWMGVNV